MKADKWWKDKVIYQIYPKSFKDSNGDGIGDLRGIIEKLDYLKDLGVDILWLSPCFQSPFADQGYDISDYYAIAEQFGTMQDLQELIDESRQKGMDIILDLVINHCSDEHEWFQKACQDPDGRYGKYFYIKDKRADGRCPTNWRSYFGGSVWSELPGHPDKLYLHVFHKKQPDLNWENPEVRKELYKMICWWLDKGIAGFRIDAIRNIRKPKVFEDYAADGEDGLCNIERMIEHAHGIGEFLTEMRLKTFDRYNAFTVAEVSGDVTEDLTSYVGQEGYFSSIFDFREIELSYSEDIRLHCPKITAEDYKEACFTSQYAFSQCGTPVNVIENHDGPRAVNRFIPRGEICPESKKMLGALYYFMKGIPCIYQGQELGMENPGFHSPDEFQDVASIYSYQYSLQQGLSPAEAMKVTEAMSRDNSRTPMPWDNRAFGGFSTVSPWIKTTDDYTERNVAAEQRDENSVLCFYKKMAALRRDARYKKTLVEGSFTPKWKTKKNLMAYVRKADKEILVVGNYKNEPDRIVMEAPYTTVLLNNYAEDPEDKIEIRLKPYQLLIMEI